MIYCSMNTAVAGVLSPLGKEEKVRCRWIAAYLALSARDECASVGVAAYETAL